MSKLPRYHSSLTRYDWSPNWFIRYRDRGGIYKKISTRTANKELAEQIKSQFDAEQLKPPKPQEQTINILLDAYLDDRHGNVNAYDTLVHSAKPIREHFGFTQPQYITDLQNKSYIKKRQKMGKSNGTIIKELVTLRSALSFGVKKKWIDKAVYIEIPPRPAPKDRWLTEEEANKLIEACKTPHIKMFILLAIKTGARKSAILQLTWDRVSFERGIIVYALPGKDHGTKRRAIVPMSKSLKKELLVIREFARTDWVIEYNGKPIKTIDEAFRSARAGSGIDHCSIHDLRRTCATWLVQKGIPTREIARMLGDTEEMIEKVYGHHSPEYLQNAANALDW